MKKLLAIILAVLMVLSLAACGGGGAEPTKKPATYPKHMGKLYDWPTCVNNELYVWNEITERKVYTFEFIPNGLKTDGSVKVPAIIYAHGGNGDANSLKTIPIELAKSNIAGFTFEACGGTNLQPKSDPGVATSSSRASDMYAVLQYVQSLPWIDQDKIFIFGESAGGAAVMSFAPQHNDDIAGMIIESAGINASTQNNPTTPGENDVPEYMPASGQGILDYYKSYNGPIIICNSVGDELGAHEAGLNAEIIFNERSQGSCIFYSCPEGAHAFNSYSAEGQQITFDAIRKLVLGE